MLPGMGLTTAPPFAAGAAGVGAATGAGAAGAGAAGATVATGAGAVGALA